MTVSLEKELHGKPHLDSGWLRQASDRVARLVLTNKHRSLDALGSGDLAELRRLNPLDPAAPGFWKLLSSLDDLIRLPAGGDALAEQEKRWACFFNAAAILAELHQRNIPLGHALAAAGYSEIRFVRLLRADGPGLYNEVRHAAHFLAAKGQAVDIYGFASLLMSDGAEYQESVRRNTARSYYSNINQ